MDADDIQRAYAGDRHARRALGEALLPAIQRAVGRRLYPIARASARDPRIELEDLVSGVWVKLFEHDWRALRRFDPDRGSLDSYVARIADFHVLSTFRVKAKDPYRDIPASEAVEGADVIQLDAEGQVWARAELVELERHIHARKGERGLALFRMVAVDELAVADVADRAGMTKAAVYQWRARMKQLIRQWRRERG